MLFKNWRRRNPKKFRRAAARVLEAFREIGILLMAFSPLEAALDSKGDGGAVFAGFFAAGLAFFVGALILEWKWRAEK